MVLKFTKRLADNIDSVKAGTLVACLPKSGKDFYCLIISKSEFGRNFIVFKVLVNGRIEAYLGDDILRNADDWYIL